MSNREGVSPRGSRGFSMAFLWEIRSENGSDTIMLRRPPFGTLGTLDENGGHLTDLDEQHQDRAATVGRNLV